MRSSNVQALLLFSFSLGSIAAPAQAPVDPAYPMITPPPTLVDRAPTPVDRRDFNVGSYLDGVFSDLGNIPSYVASGCYGGTRRLANYRTRRGKGCYHVMDSEDSGGSPRSPGLDGLGGVPNFFQDLPTGGAVLSKLNISNGDLDAQPTKVLNIPGYANWTEDGWSLLVHGNVYKQPNISESKLNDLANVFLIGTDWSLLVHGNVYKQPNISESKLNDLANVFLIGTDIKDLPESQQVQARNLTAEIFVVAQDHVNISFTVVPDVAQPSGQAGALVVAKAGSQEIIFPEQTTDEGDFAQFIGLKNTTGTGGSHLLAGNDTTSIQVLNYYALNATGGNATGLAQLLRPPIHIVISDIDDILRVTQIYKPAEGLLNSFARPFRPWLNMPAHYAKWASAVPDLHFHYLTTTPEQVTPNYMDYIFKTYPHGSFDTRPLNFSDGSATLSIRKFLLQRVFETFPRRKFVLVADTSNSDVMSDYPALVGEFPNQVQCIWLRNTSSTDSDDKFPYNTKGFKDVDPKKYMFFNVHLAPEHVLNGLG
ncbi:hypothetical protein V495_02647 [Pseudogymnoascus sp. VKM F-4514 (FW-929)]|nr:hypothetical protein V495_02647 [Pseudogymnoascus sp. VKM F-4514 (FW-929)]